MDLSPSERREPPMLGVAVVVGLASVLVFSLQVIDFELLLWDDNRILGFLLGPGSHGSRGVSRFFDPTPTNLATPVSVAVWSLLADLFGPRPSAFHLVSAVLHGVNVLLVALLCRTLMLLTPAKSSEPSSRTWVSVASLVAAGLWGLHPSRAEVVGWVAAMPYSLSTTLGLLAVLSFLRGVTARGSRCRWLLAGSALLFALGALAHPQIAPLCFVLLLLDRHVGRAVRRARDEPSRGPVSARLWHLVTFAIAAAIVLLVLGARGPGNPTPLATAFGGRSLLSAASLRRSLAFTFDFSLLHAWIPLNNSLVYPGYDNVSWRSGHLWLAVALGTLWGFWALRDWRRGRSGSLLAFAAHVVLAGSASGLFFSKFLCADRYTYAPTIIVTVLLAHLVHWGLKRCTARRWKGVMVTGLVLGLMASAVGQTAALAHWRGTVPLMKHFVATAPDLEWKLFAQLRIATYWDSQKDAQRAARALMDLLRLPSGSADERFATVVAYLVSVGSCAEARFLRDISAGVLDPRQQHFLQSLLRRCR